MNRRTLLGLPLAAALAGCNNSPSSSGATDTPPNAPAAEDSGSGGLRVGLLTNGSLTDNGWNSLAGEGLKQIEQELGATTSHQSESPAQAEEALRGFAQDGCKLVFAHGAEYGDAAKRVAAEFSDTVFVVSSGEVQGDNLASLRFDIGEASYLAGMLAAALSKSGKAGQIGGQDFPPVEQGFRLFEQGGKTVKPGFSTKITYLGNWSDANGAKEKALAMIRDGADVMFQNADAAGEGVFQAAKESKSVLVFGSNANQNDLYPDLVPASAVLDVAKTFLGVARDVKENRFKGGVYLEDLKSGNVYLAVNPKFEDQIPEDVKEKLKQAEEEIKSGKLQLVKK